MPRKSKREELQEKFILVKKDSVLLEDHFMQIFFDGDTRCIQAIINILMERKDIIVKSVVPQKRFYSSMQRCIIIDIYAEDSEHNLYNFEFQRDKRGASPKRVRVHGSIIDSNNIAKGEEFDKIPDRYIIFFTETDYWGDGDTLYILNKTIGRKNHPYDDGAYVIYVNCSAENDGSEIWKVAHDMTCKNVNEMLVPELAERARFFKEDPEGEIKMIDSIQKHFGGYIKQEKKKTAIKAKAQGIAQGIARSVKKLIAAGKMSLDEIASVMEMPLADVQAIAKSIASEK